MADLDLSKGHSNLDLGHSFSSVTNLRVKYTTDSGVAGVASLSFGVPGEAISRIELELPADNIDTAISLGEQIVNHILDYLVYEKRVPLSVSVLNVYDASQGTLLCRYMTHPYTARRAVEITDFQQAQRMPSASRPALRLFREAISSSSVHYRFLSLWKMNEAIKKLQATNNAALVGSGTRPTRKQVVLASSEVTIGDYARFVGRPVGALLAHLQEEFRNDIAHFNLASNEQIQLDPGNVRSQHRIDMASLLLEEALRGLLAVELELMEEHGL